MVAVRGRATMVLAAIWTGLAASQALTTGTHAQAADPKPAADVRRSGLSYTSAATQALQRDDSQNPAMLWVADGQALWSAPGAVAGTSRVAAQTGAAVASCQSCHGDAATSMRGVAARYPAWDTALQRVVALNHRINLCRQRHQHADPWPVEHPSLLGLQAYVAMQSRGMPMMAGVDLDKAPLAESIDRGRAYYQQRIGQLALSCAQCHDARDGLRLGGSVIPQAHPTGYPIYRLQWQSLGSLQRRIQGCLTGVRAQVLPPFSEAMAELEIYLAARAVGMPVESPGVRP